MDIQVKLSSILDGMAVQSDEMSSYLNRETAEVVLISDYARDMAESGEGNEGISEWEQDEIETAREVLGSGKFIALPSRWEIDEYRIMERFSFSREDAQLSETLPREIQGSGAFRRFKEAIRDFGIEDDWFRFRDEAYRDTAVDWCERHSLEYVEG